MRLALIEVARHKSNRPGYNEFHYNLALGYLAAAAENNGHTVLIIQQRPGETDDTLIERIVDFKPDAAGFTCNTHTYPMTVLFKKKLADRISDCLFLIGGVHATCTLDESTADFDVVVCGEGEETLIELLDAMQQGWETSGWQQLRGIAYRDNNGNIIENPRRERLTDLDKYGPPKRIKPLQYQDKQIYPAVPGHPPFAPISFSRGCRMNCTFCTNAKMYQSTLVTRKPEKVVDEMLMLRDKYGITDFYVHDEDILSDANLVREICKQLIEAKARVTWMGMCSINRITAELAELMSAAGCIMLAFGLESGAEILRNEYRKPFDAQNAHNKISAVFDAGIVPVGLFVLGTPHETDDSLEVTLSFATSLKCIRFRFAYVYPYTGTVMRDEIDRNGLWLSDEYKKHEYACADIPVIECQVGDRELASKQMEFLTHIYTSNKYINNIHEFVRKNPEWKYSILDEWKRVVEKEIGQKVHWEI